MPTLRPAKSVNAPGFDVYYLSAVNFSGGPTAVQAVSMFVSSVSWHFDFIEFPGGDPTGGVGPTSTAEAIASRSAPTGTFCFLPSATASAVQNIADSNGGFASGVTTNAGFQSFRESTPYVTSDPHGLILGAIVVPHGGWFDLHGVVNDTLESVNSVPYAFANLPEPDVAAAAVSCALVVNRRAKKTWQRPRRA